ncbi:hypothetical protein NDU88_009689 [Pleurodeles waltl]|uniref:Uncharacterized protein n=1 Tax=Pleurodeles waltl TaxID=8319 RepID=A0AAV7S134_PLEWA|nr:hypothetical protein NDU88_009689 [Pleurodeles waltl]
MTTHKGNKLVMRACGEVKEKEDESGARGMSLPGVEPEEALQRTSAGVDERRRRKAAESTMPEGLPESQTSHHIIGGMWLAKKRNLKSRANGRPQKRAYWVDSSARPGGDPDDPWWVEACHLSWRLRDPEDRPLGEGEKNKNPVLKGWRLKDPEDRPS